MKGWIADPKPLLHRALFTHVITQMYYRRNYLSIDYNGITRDFAIQRRFPELIPEEDIEKCHGHLTWMLEFDGPYTNRPSFRNKYFTLESIILSDLGPLSKNIWRYLYTTTMRDYDILNYFKLLRGFKSEFGFNIQIREVLERNNYPGYIEYYGRKSSVSIREEWLQ